MCENLVCIGWNWRYVNFQGGGAEAPYLGGGVTCDLRGCDAHFRTCRSYSSQKSYVKIWFWLFEPFKSYCVHRQKKKKLIIIIEFSGGQKSPIRGVTFDLWCPFSDSDALFQSKVMCENLVWIGWNRRYVKFHMGTEAPYGGEGVSHVTCDAHFRTWPSYFS